MVYESLFISGATRSIYIYIYISNHKYIIHQLNEILHTDSLSFDDVIILLTVFEMLLC